MEEVPLNIRICSPVRSLARFRASPWVRDGVRAARLALGAALAVAGLSVFMAPGYRSQARLLPLEARGSSALGGMAAAAAAMGIGIPSADGSDITYPEIISSRWLRENLLDTPFTYVTKGTLLARPRTETRTLRQYLGVPGNDQACQALGELITTQRDLKSKMLTVAVETRSPQLSQAALARTLTLLETFLMEKAQTRGRARAAFAASRLKEAEAEFALREQALKRFIEVNRNYSISPDPTVRISGLHLEGSLRLQQQLVSTLAINREQALLEEKNDVPLLNILDSANLPTGRSRPARARMTLLAFVLVFGGSLGWLQRRALLAGLSPTLDR